MVEAWDHDKRAKIKRKIDDAAEIARRKLGARGVIVIAYFDDHGYVHCQDGCTVELPADILYLYQNMVKAYTIMDESGGEDVVVQ